MPDKIKLLFVDDEEKFLMATADRLRLRGFDVTTVTNGSDAVDIARNEKFDLALLDLKMPGLDGQQVLEILKKEHQYLEVIMLTGHGSFESSVECARLGVYSYLPKPYEMDKLLEVMKNAYEARLKKKFEKDQARMDQIMKIATGSSPLAILQEIKKLDDDEK